MSVTFRIDDVPRAAAPLSTIELAARLGDALCFGGDPMLPVVEHGPTHALLGAVHLAFAEHRPLVLSPDAVWLTITQGIAQHVRLHAEELRPRLVRHAGTKRIEVAWDGPMPTDAASWTTIVGAFREHVANEVGAGRARLIECDFSTTTDVERIASQVVLMDVFSPYFDYYLMCICGIPEVTLLGTVADWKRIRERIDVVRELSLDFWAQSLVPICDELVRAASGAPDIAFWRRIYKPRDAYGGAIITGWIARLYPYLVSEGAAARRNPLLDLPIDEPRDQGDGNWYQGPGIRTGDVLASASTARIHVVDLVRGERRIVALEGGVTAVSQDAEGRLSPICTWALRTAGPNIGDALERIREKHVFEPPTERTGDIHSELSGPADFMALYATFDEATLFAETNPWMIRPPSEHESIEFALPYGRTESALRFIDLPDGTFLAMTSDPRSPVFVRGRIDALEPTRPPEPGEMKLRPIQRRSRQSFEEITIVRKSITEILIWALDSQGSPEIAEDGHLRDVLAPWQLEPPPPPRERKRKR